MFSERSVASGRRQECRSNRTQSTKRPRLFICLRYDTQTLETLVSDLSKQIMCLTMYQRLRMFMTSVRGESYYQLSKARMVSLKINDVL